MAIERKYEPTQRVNIGPGKDTLNDFARKYNLEVEAVYDVLNKHNARKVVFYSTSDYWSETDTGYKLSLAHNGNIVFAVYRTDGEDNSAQVLVGVSMTKTNVELESVEKFDGFMLYAAINEDVGIGYNVEDDVIAIFNDIKDETEDLKDETEAARDEVNETLSTIHEQLNAFLNEHSDGVMQFDENFDIMPCQFPICNDLWDVNEDGSLTPIDEPDDGDDEPSSESEEE